MSKTSKQAGERTQAHFLKVTDCGDYYRVTDELNQHSSIGKSFAKKCELWNADQVRSFLEEGR